MNAQKVIKFNLYMSGILLLVFVMMFLGATIAYFSDNAKTSTILTSGNVKITLSEAAVIQDASGNFVEDLSKPRIFGSVEAVVVDDSIRVYPGMRIFKDPTITNTGDAPEWIAARVTLTAGSGDLHKILGYPNYDEIDIEKLLTGGLLDEHVDVEDWNGIPDVCVGERYVMIQKPNRAEGAYEFYFLMLRPVEVGEHVTIFESIVFDPMWTGAHMQEMAELQIHVQAYGVQLFQLESCLQAMTSAFPDHFAFDTYNPDIK